MIVLESIEIGFAACNVIRVARGFAFVALFALCARRMKNEVHAFLVRNGGVQDSGFSSIFRD